MKIEVDRVIYVKECMGCPFSFMGDYWGGVYCTLDNDLVFDEGMKKGEVHDNCPLKEHKTIVRLNEIYNQTK